MCAVLVRCVRALYASGSSFPDMLFLPLCLREWYIGTGGGTDAEFPFGIVQVGPSSEPNSPPPSAATFLIRMGQTAGYGYAPNIVWPKVFMATALDLANPPGTKCFAGCVHLFNKQAVAHRLVLAARSVVYGEMSLVYSGPRVEHVRFGGCSVTLTYGVGTEGKGLALRSGYGFEVCGADCNATASDPAVWRPAAVAASTRTTITITFGVLIFQSHRCGTLRF